MPTSMSTFRRDDGLAHRKVVSRVLALAFLTITLFYLITDVSWHRQDDGATATLSVCAIPETRREWRTLSRIDKFAYINAVKCLQGKASSYLPGLSIFDEYSWVHSQIGARSHDVASFLPWHRWFMHLYEQRLHLECGYPGPLPYWNWALDWPDLHGSPVFSSSEGFGPDGVDSVNNSAALDGTRCVSTGPFGGQWAHFYADRALPHCLSRRFAQGSELEYINSMLSPGALDHIMHQRTYSSFLKLFEETAHSAIPFFMGGDFKVLTAPNDPLFFLHHVQIDRLWWLWQRQDPDVRQQQYEGKRERESTAKASSEDELDFGILDYSLQVKDVMETESMRLCYRY